VPRILVIHGPNLNLLGTREPEVYGTRTHDDINASLVAQGAVAGAEIEAVQSNCEGEIVTHIQRARGAFDAILINPGGYSHTSIAIRDALAGTGVPAVEVHLTNLHRRERFRRRSMTAGACVGAVMGFGAQSYAVALAAILGHLGVATHARGPRPEGPPA
jgi:3-dehydroquinate dehydratase-2